MAKRHGNLWAQITSLDNLRLAFKRARRGKNHYTAVKEFAANEEENLRTVQRLLVCKQFHTADYQTKEIWEPNHRTIYILPFYPDRIVQHALVNVLEPVWTGLFIADTYACIEGRGLHAGSKRCMEFVRRYNYCLKCDVRKFYPSIDQQILYDIICRKIKCPDTLWLLHDIIFSYNGGKNAPIGNLTSQWFGNLYLNELDQLVKHGFKQKAYLRYCDDFLLFGNNKEELRALADIVQVFLLNRLKLELSKCDLFPTSRGVDFLGYRHFKDFMLVRKSTAKRIRRRLAALPEQIEGGYVRKQTAIGQIASARGVLKHANARNFQKNARLDDIAAQITTREFPCGLFYPAVLRRTVSTYERNTALIPD